MQKTMIVGVICLASAALAAEPSGLGRGEAPRATDLLRAERMAREARERLQLRPRPGAKWLRGGEGWSSKSGGSEPRAPVINVYPGRGRVVRR